MEVRENTSGIPIKDFFSPNDVAFIDYEKDIGNPGEYPFTRGLYPTGYRSKLWTMRQYAGFGTADETNQRYKYLLSRGQTGLSVAFDLPTQLGLDSDNPLSRGEVGKVGVAIDTLYDMERLFDGIPLNKVSTSMTINATAIILLSMYIAVAKKQGVSLNSLRGTIQNDILKEYIARGTYIFPPRESLELIVETFRFCAKYVPQWNTISISGYHIREAGATAVQELAFTFLNAMEYIKAGIKAGLSVDDFLPRISFFFNAHNNFFEEIAKFRAARKIWAKITKEKFGARNKKSWFLRFHTQTAGSTLTRNQIENNIVRVALQALSAVLGGTQSLHTNAKDEAISLPTEDSAKTALRTQQIIAYETGVIDTTDPLAGSYYIEYLTNEIEKKVFEKIKEIEDYGGMLKAIEDGKINQEIESSAYLYQKKIESGEIKIVGVNIFADEEEDENDIENFEVPPEVEEEQIKRLLLVKKERDEGKVKKSLEELERAAKDRDGIFEAVINAVENYATIGEITNSLKKVFGTYRFIYQEV